MKWFLGARLVICGRNQERLQAVHAELRGADHVMQECDFAQSEGIAPWLKAVCKEVSALKGPTYCAAVQATRPIQAINTQLVDPAPLQNLRAAVELARPLRL